MLLLTVDFHASSASVVKRPLRKPNCLLCSPSFSSRYCLNRLSKIFSNSFPRQSRRHRGLYDVESSNGLSPFLIGTNRADFHVLGNTPSSKHALYTSRIASGLSVTMIFRASFGIPSGPGTLLFFRHLAELISSVCAIGMGSVPSVIRKGTLTLLIGCWGRDLVRFFGVSLAHDQFVRESPRILLYKVTKAFPGNFLSLFNWPD